LIIILKGSIYHCLDNDILAVKMNIFEQIRQIIIDSLNQLASDGKITSNLNYENITAEPPKDKSHGDVATNVAMVLAKPCGQNPKQLAELILPLLLKNDDIENVTIAGPGFINIKLKTGVWLDSIKTIIESKKDYGNNNLGKNQKINLEYVSVNPTGPMHVGHARGAVFGDCLALLLLKCGYQVTKEYYINDAGGQIDVLARSCYLRYLQALGEEVTIGEGLYPGEYLIIVGEGLKQQYGSDLKFMDEHQWLPIVKQYAVDAMMAIIKSDLAELGVYHDVFTSELKLHQQNKIVESVEILNKKSLVYKGLLDAPKGKLQEDWEMREQLLFKATEFGDDIDRPLQKSNGDWTYFGAEIAYVNDKLLRGYNLLIMVLGADHGGYVKRTKAAVSALSDNRATIDIKICQLVNFMQNNEPMKMSKRAGSYVTVHDVIEMVGKDALRFMMLTRKNDMVMDFDIDKVKEQSKDNPVFYVQYAHARCQSILRNARDDFPLSHTRFLERNYDDLKHLISEYELELIKFLASWPRIVESAAIHYEPHRIVFYLLDLAALFHGLWNKGKEDKSLRFIINSNLELSTARLLLVQAVTTVIASGLFVLNIEPANEM
jgi:arginyl-tRNA synthetase